MPESKDKDCAARDRPRDAVQFALMKQQVFVLLLFSYVIKSSGGDGGTTWPRSQRVGRLAQGAIKGRPLVDRPGSAPANVVFPLTSDISGWSKIYRYNSTLRAFICIKKTLIATFPKTDRWIIDCVKRTLNRSQPTLESRFFLIETKSVYIRTSKINLDLLEKM